MRKIFILLLLQFLFSCENKITEKTKVSMGNPQIETRKDSVGLDQTIHQKAKENNSQQSDKTTGKKMYGVVLYTVYDEGLSENLPKFTEIFLVDSEISKEDEQRIINSKINNQYNEKIVYKVLKCFDTMKELQYYIDDFNKRISVRPTSNFTYDTIPNYTVERSIIRFNNSLK